MAKASKRGKAYKDTVAALPDDPRFEAEYKRLFDVFDELPDDLLEVARKLISRAAFMAVKLEDLEKTIAADGVMSEYQNGKDQWGTKKSPEVEVYISMVKNYTAVTKQLTELLPREDRGAAEDDFAAFVSSR